MKHERGYTVHSKAELAERIIHRIAHNEVLTLQCKVHRLVHVRLASKQLEQLKFACSTSPLAYF